MSEYNHEQVRDVDTKAGRILPRLFGNRQRQRGLPELRRGLPAEPTGGLQQPFRREVRRLSWVHNDDAAQKLVRDHVLGPGYYDRFSFDGRYVYLTKGTLDMSAFAQIRSAVPSGPGVILESADRLLVTPRRL